MRKPISSNVRRSAKASAASGTLAAPGFIEFCDPTLREKPPPGNQWLYEIKADGYRAQIHVNDKNVTVYSRSGYKWTDRFPTIAEAARKLRARQAILDGEAVVMGANGIPDFQALRRELSRKDSKRVVYLAFDLLYLDGRDLRQRPYVERKRQLQALLAGAAVVARRELAPTPLLRVHQAALATAAATNTASAAGKRGSHRELTNNTAKLARPTIKVGP
jgi:ATP-dependent DNA ligase